MAMAVSGIVLKVLFLDLGKMLGNGGEGGICANKIVKHHSRVAYPIPQKGDQEAIVRRLMLGRGPWRGGREAAGKSKYYKVIWAGSATSGL
jgi:hypothetical protein